jgi:hypothetical protein
VFSILRGAFLFWGAKTAAKMPALTQRESGAFLALAEAGMSDWPKDEEGVLFFRTRQVAEAAAAKCNATRHEPGVRWRVIEHDGKFYVAGFIGRELYDAL